MTSATLLPLAFLLLCENLKERQMNKSDAQLDLPTKY